MSRRRALIATLAVLAACAGPPATGPVQRITVPPGATFSQVVDSLQAHHLVRSRLWLKLLARVQRMDRAIPAGVYQFAPGLSTTEILAVLRTGRTAEVKLTVPEGLTIPEVAALAVRAGIPADSFIRAARDTAFADSLGFPGGTFEGFLHPDTYFVPVGSSARELIRMMAREFEASWRPGWTARLDSLHLTRRELVTLASIVEGEARADDERETIAGVYANRLRIGMALQADPTVQYAILLRTGERKPRLYEKDYGTPSPYNTYLHPGLPPGPVNSPGVRSIEAALHPAAVPYLYFVAGPDGRHRFSRTYSEHRRAVAAARRARAADQAGAP